MSRFKINILKQESAYWVDRNLISAEQQQAILGEYAPSMKRFEFFYLMGAFLIGLGLLSYVASNWDDLTRYAKVALIFLFYVGFMLTGWRFDRTRPRFSQSMRVLAAFAYGGGIFLLAQIFHQGGHYTQALYWWMLGLIPAVLLFEDRAQLTFLQAIAFIWLNGIYAETIFRYQLFHVTHYAYTIFALLLGGLFWVGSNAFSMTVTLIFFENFFGWYLVSLGNVHGISVFFLGLCFLGALLVILGRLIQNKYPVTGAVIRRNGLVLLGICGIFLSFPYVWEHSTLLRLIVEQFSAYINIYAYSSYELMQDAAITSAILYIALMVSYIKSGSLTAVTFFCIMIFRYYFDQFYDFMPKAIFFTLAGVLLLVMGFFLEQLRRKRKRLAEQHSVENSDSAEEEAR